MRRSHVIAIGIVAITLILLFIAGGVFVYTTARNQGDAFQRRTGVTVPEDSDVTVIAQSDSLPRRQYVAVYLIRTPVSTEVSTLAPGHTLEPIDDELSLHLEELSDTATFGYGFVDFTPSACTITKAATANSDDEAILCRTEEEQEWLLYEVST